MAENIKINFKLALFCNGYINQKCLFNVVLGLVSILNQNVSYK